MSKTVQLKHYRINSLQMNNPPRQNVKMHLENKYSYNVKYSNNNTCLGELSVSISDKDAPDMFSVKFVIAGVFGVEPSALNDKYSVHYETFRTLFAYAQASLTQISALSGIAPIIMPEVDIENQEIYQVKLPKPNPPENKN